VEMMQPNLGEPLGGFAARRMKGWEPRPGGRPPTNGAVVDRRRPVLRPHGFNSRQKTKTMIAEPHFDADNKFIHRCRKCGGEAPFGFSVSLRRGRLGTWYCANHKTAATNDVNT